MLKQHTAPARGRFLQVDYDAIDDIDGLSDATLRLLQAAVKLAPVNDKNIETLAKSLNHGRPKRKTALEEMRKSKRHHHRKLKVAWRPLPLTQVMISLVPLMTPEDVEAGWRAAEEAMRLRKDTDESRRLGVRILNSVFWIDARTARGQDTPTAGSSSLKGSKTEKNKNPLLLPPGASDPPEQPELPEPEPDGPECEDQEADAEVQDGELTDPGQAGRLFAKQAREQHADSHLQAAGKRIVPGMRKESDQHKNQHQEVEGERRKRSEPWERELFQDDEQDQSSESVLVGETAWKHKALAEYGERLASLVRRAETLAGKQLTPRARSRLTKQAAERLVAGESLDRVRAVLCEDFPDEIDSVNGLLTWRLRNRPIEVASMAELEAERSRQWGVCKPQVASMRECDGCKRPLRPVVDERLCGECRSNAAAQEQPRQAVEQAPSEDAVLSVSGVLDSGGWRALQEAVASGAL